MERTLDLAELPNGNLPTPASAVAAAGANRPATAAVLAAVLLGMLGDALFRAPGLGISLLLWAAAAVAATIWVSRVHQRRIARAHWWPVGPLLFFAAVFAWRTADGLLVLNLFAMLSAFMLLALAVGGQPVDLVRAGMGDFIFGGISIGLSGAVGTPILIAGDRALSDRGARPRWRTAMAIARGALIAIPVLVVFGALLTAADARFEQILATLVDIDFAETVGHIVFAGFIGWVAGGYLRAAAVADHPLGLPAGARPRRLALGMTELATVFGLIDALFLLFVAIQLPHLFGGAAHVQYIEGLTVAEYARSGFFELVTVAALVLPLLLVGAALVKPGSDRDWRVYRALSAGMIALVGLMVASALQRLTLYVASFGLSEGRVYATAAIVWLAIVFSLFASTVLRRRSGGFAFAAMISGWLVLVALDVANPQALVVRINAGRATASARFDWKYAAALDADAAPALANVLPTLDAESRCAVAARLDGLTAERQARLIGDWRSWNLGRARAFRASTTANLAPILARCPETVIADH